MPTWVSQADQQVLVSRHGGLALAGDAPVLAASRAGAPELPDLGEVWFGAGRAGLVAALTDYLTRRAASGAVRLPGPALVVARTILETCVLWAVHLRWDPAGGDPGSGNLGDRELPPPEVVAATLAGLLTHGLVARKE